MTPSDLYFVLCLFGFLSWLSPPISERRTVPKVARRTKANAGRQTKRKPKRTKAKKQKRYKPPPLSVEQQMMFDQYKLKQSGITWNESTPLQ